MKIKVQVVNAFSLDGKGGNPAGIVFNADKLTNKQKQTVASKAGFPETAFVSASSVADYKLDFFTPVKQIPHCGHATIATFSYLKQNGQVTGDHSSKETIDGTRSILFKGGLAFMEQRAPVFEIPSETDVILDSIGITKADLIPGQLPTIVNTGNSFMILPIRDEALLASIKYDKVAVAGISEKFGLIGFYLFTYPENSSYDVTTRMFAPFYGIEEEAGTGMAAGPLAAYLYSSTKKKQSKFLIEQGRYMNIPSISLIQVDLDISVKGIERLFAGGTAYQSGEKIVEIP